MLKEVEVTAYCICIADSIRIKLPYPLLDFPQTSMVFCVETYCLAVWLLYFLVDLVALV